MEFHLSAEARILIIEEDANCQIEEAYLSGSGGLPRDAVHLLQRSKEQVLQWPLTTKQQWLDSLEVAKKQWQQSNQDPLAGERALMVTWVLH